MLIKSNTSNTGVIRILSLVVLLCLALTGCLSFLGPLNQDDKILGYPVIETILILEENYSDDSTFIPAGIYLPDSKFSRGVANYVGNKPLSVKLMGFINRECRGGISTDFDAPFNKYRVFLYDCGGETVITHNLSKSLRFKIVKADYMQLIKS